MSATPSAEGQSGLSKGVEGKMSLARLVLRKSQSSLVLREANQSNRARPSSAAAIAARLSSARHANSTSSISTLSGSGKSVGEESTTEKTDSTIQADIAAPAGKSHLIVLVNGVNGHYDNWKEFHSLSLANTELSHVCFYPSRANSKRQTFAGIDTCGERLAKELHMVVAANVETLRHISFIGHSMGGLVCRYAIGRLYETDKGRILGLQPAHFVTLASPHLGCDGDGESQVPMLGWARDVPVIGTKLQGAMAANAAAVTASLLGKSGEQLFLEDGCKDSGRLPLLERLTTDEPKNGCLFISGLKAFFSRTVYANATNDHLVSWANSSLRFKAELPSLNNFKDCPIREAEQTQSPPCALSPRSGWSTSGPHQFLPAEAGKERETRGNCSSNSPDVSLRGALSRRRPKAEPVVDSYANLTVADMLLRLQSMSWRRVDVSFKGSPTAFMAHNHIQVTRKWMNKAGLPTINHLLGHLTEIENKLLRPPARAADRQQDFQTQ